MESNDSANEVGRCAAILSSIEVGLGSFFHAFHIPSSGHWLSLNQAFWLARLSFRSTSATAPLTASNVTSCMKSFSPAGKRLSPMLAISAQGGLYNLGTFALGRNLVGVSLGAVLLSIWAFIHPVFIYYIIFGKSLFVAYGVLFKKCQAIFHFSNAQAIHAIAIIVTVKALLAIGVVMLARWLPQSSVDSYREKVAAFAVRSARPQPAGAASSPAIAALHDLMNPLFLISLVLTAVFFVWSESSHVVLIWALLRPIAVGFILFFSIRMLPMERFIAGLEKRGFLAFASALRFAHSEIAGDGSSRNQSSAPDRESAQT